MLSFSAKEFIRKLMCKDPKKRFSCKQAIAFPWYVYKLCHVLFSTLRLMKFNNIYHMSHIRPCIIMDKPLVVYIFSIIMQ